MTASQPRHGRHQEEDAVPEGRDREPLCHHPEVRGPDQGVPTRGGSGQTLAPGVGAGLFHTVYTSHGCLVLYFSDGKVAASVGSGPYGLAKEYGFLFPKLGP